MRAQLHAAYITLTIHVLEINYTQFCCHSPIHCTLTSQAFRPLPRYLGSCFFGMQPYCNISRRFIQKNLVVPFLPKCHQTCWTEDMWILPHPSQSQTKFQNPNPGLGVFIITKNHHHVLFESFVFLQYQTI